MVMILCLLRATGANTTLHGGSDFNTFFQTTESIAPLDCPIETENVASLPFFDDSGCDFGGGTSLDQFEILSTIVFSTIGKSNLQSRYQGALFKPIRSAAPLIF